ncbi:MAG: tetratricopeptide repeat protein [Verrucomicrobiales bacterium]
MSHSPTDDQILAVHADYHEATRRLDRLVRAGYSWSGHEKNVAFLHTGLSQGVPRFADISALSGFNFPDDGRALGLTDWDRDGDLDAWVVNRTAPQVRFLENTTRTGTKNEPAFFRLLLSGDGKSCARDATGARAELAWPGSGPRLVRAVATGDTHCSQSSRWLHFGLGKSAATTAKLSLTVRWPDGKTESFSGLKSNHHYLLRRGGRPEVAPKPDPTAASAAAGQPIPEPPKGLTLYSNRLPPPPLAWPSDDGKPASLTDFSGRPVALLLWASWCPSCQHELKGLADRARQLKAAGVSLVALNLDAVTAASGGDLDAARQLWHSAAVPGAAAGQADAALLGRLESFRAALHWMGGPLRIPALFLFDAEGRLVASGEGTLDDAAWSHALKALAASPDQWIKLALPIPGRHYGPIGALRLADVPQVLMEDHAFDLAAEYLTLHRDTLERAYRDNREPTLPRTLSTLAVHLAQSNRPADAVAVYRQAVALKPSFIDARYNLASLLRDLGETAEAIDHFSRILAQAPQHAASWHNRGLARQQSGDLDGAISDFEQALAFAPASIDTLNNLANSLLEAGRDDDALARFHQALALNPADPRTHYNHALALEKAVRWPEAADAYRRAIDLDPPNPQYYHNLGVLFAKQARWDEAESLLRRTLELQPDHAAASRNLQRVLETRPPR